MNLFEIESFFNISFENTFCIVFLLDVIKKTRINIGIKEK